MVYIKESQNKVIRVGPRPLTGACIQRRKASQHREKHREKEEDLKAN